MNPFNGAGLSKFTSGRTYTDKAVLLGHKELLDNGRGANKPRLIILLTDGAVAAWIYGCPITLSAFVVRRQLVVYSRCTVGSQPSAQTAQC